MSENKDLSREEQELTGKNVSFYEVFLGAWVQNRMEKDKSILTLSSLSIGLLVTFLNTINTVGEFALWILSTLSFVVAIIVNLLIFSQNSDYIEEVIRNTNQDKQMSIETKLRRKTIFSFSLFILGIILTFVLVMIQSGFKLIKVS